MRGLPRFSGFRALPFLRAVIRDTPRWLFAAALIYAPWDYGGTTAASTTRIHIFLSIILGLWLLEMGIRRRKPELPLALIVTCTVILLFGWFTVFNAKAIYDIEFEVFAPVRHWLKWASSVDAPVSFATMVWISLLVGSILFVADLSRRPNWLLRMWIAIGVAGGSIALLGLLQRTTGAVLPFWEYQEGDIPIFFATYYYHGNAGAFLNLVFPLTAGLALRAVQKPDAPVQRAIWSAATLLIGVSIFTNTSRVAQLLGVSTMVVLAVGPARRLWHYNRVRPNRLALAGTIAVILLVLFAIAQASDLTKTVGRWQVAIQEIPRDARWPAYQMAWQALPKAGWTGFGPGTFQLVFPEYERLHAVAEPGHWQFLHQDYLQTILEWGWAGAACWAVVFFGGIGVAIRAFGRLRRQLPMARISRVLPLTLIALGSVMLHSLVDFPLQVASLQLYAATYLGICWSCSGANRLLARK